MIIISARRVAVAGIIGLVSLSACSGSDDAADTTAVVEESTAPTGPVDTVAPVPDSAAVTTPVAVDTVPPTDADVTTPPAAAGDTLTIAEFAYSDLTATAGTEFTISNEDGFAHTVSDRDAIFDVRVEGSATEPLTIAEPGTYEIFCRIHPSMSGTITVV